MKVLPARPEMLEDICALHFGAHTTEADRVRIRRDHRAIFENPWNRRGHPAGYVLAGAEGIQGFMGAFHSERTVQGKSREFCNLSYWMVAEGFRTLGLRLLMPFLTDPDRIITIYTASRTAYGVYERLGFKSMETGVRIVPNLPFPHRWRRGVQVIQDPAAIRPLVDPDTATLCADHTGFRCWHLLVTDGRSRCYLLYSLTHKRRQPMAYIHHVSDPAAFAAFLEVIKFALLRRHRFGFMAIDERLLAGAVPRFSIRFDLPVPRIYQGDDITPQGIDSAYTELAAIGSFETYFY